MSAAIHFGVLGGKTIVSHGSWATGEYQQLSQLVEDRSVRGSTLSRQSSLSSCSEVSTGTACREFLKCLYGAYQELRFQVRMVFQPATSLAFLDAFRFEESCLPEEIQYEYTFEQRTQLAEKCRQKVGEVLRNVQTACNCARCQALLQRPRSAETALGLYHSRANSLSLQHSGLFTSTDFDLVKDAATAGLGDIARQSLTRTSLMRNSLTRGSLKRSGSLPELWQLAEDPHDVPETEAVLLEDGESDVDERSVRTITRRGLRGSVAISQDAVQIPPPVYEIDTDMHDDDCERERHNHLKLSGVLNSASRIMHGTGIPAEVDALVLPKALEPYSPPSSLQELIASGILSPNATCSKGLWKGRMVVRRTFQVHTSDPLLKERFLWEAAVTLALDHPYILKLYTCDVVLLDADSAPDTKAANDAYPAVWEVTRVEEHYDHTLAHAMEHGQLSEAASWQVTVVQILFDIARALQELHVHNIFYCYLQPSNIALTLCHASTSLPPVFTAKLSDLQCSRFVRQYQSEADDTPLTRDLLKYVAPEVLQSQAESPAADVYSLGVLLWELLWGEASKAAGNHSPLSETSDVLQHLIHLARACMMSAADQRPHMSEVVECLKGAMLSLLVSTKQWV